MIKSAMIKDNWFCSLFNIENIGSYDRNITTFKIMNRLCPENLFNKCLQRSSVSLYNTRNCRDLQVPRYRTECAKKAFIILP